MLLLQSVLVSKGEQDCQWAPESVNHATGHHQDGGPGEYGLGGHHWHVISHQSIKKDADCGWILTSIGYLMLMLAARMAKDRAVALTGTTSKALAFSSIELWYEMVVSGKMFLTITSRKGSSSS